MIRRSVTSPDACCAAAALRTRADRRSTTESVMARNGGTTQNISTHQSPVGKNQPPTFGPTTVLTTIEQIPNPTTVVR